MRHVLFLLGHLNDLDIEWMINNGTRTEFGTGDLLISKGQAMDNLYIILSGELSIVDGESEKSIALIGAGQIVGEMSFLESRLPSVSVVVREPSSVFCISKELMNERLGNNLEFKANFYYAISLFLSNRLRQTTTQLGYGSPNDEDVLDENVLDGVSQAGSRFNQILQKFSEV